MTTPLVSVVMPAYNCELYVRHAIESVLAQTYENWELLVLDDASTDGTFAAINSFLDPRIRKFQNKTNQGNVRSRNLLFDNVRGDLITVVDADDLIEPTKLEIQVRYFKDQPELDVCLTNFIVIDIEGSIKQEFHFNDNIPLTPDNFSHSFFTVPATVMLKTSVYKKIGGLNLYFDRLYGDDTYWIYLMVENHNVLLLKDSLYFYRANPFSLTNDVNSLRKLTVMALVKELIRQRRSRGTDWLSEGNHEAARAFEEQLLTKRKWLGEKYRIFAARYIGLGRVRESRQFVWKALTLNPWNVDNLRTLLYYLRCIIKRRK